MTNPGNSADKDIDIFFKMLSMDDPIPELHGLRESDPVHFVQPLGF